MMRSLLAIMMTMLIVAGCTSQDIAAITEQGLILSGRDAEKAGQIGEAAGRTIGATGEMNLQTERDIGGGIAVKSLAMTGRLHRDEQLQRYVNLVGGAVARYSSRPQVPYSFAVVDSDEINAWAAPGGYVFITTGALRQMDNEAQLAGVLAHEIIHVSERHMVRMLQRTQFFDGIAQGVSATTDRDLSNYSRAVDQGTDVIFARGFDRSMEHDADLEGMELAAVAGYDPAGLVQFLENVRRARGDTGGGWLSSTHPSLGDRLTRMRQQLEGPLAGIGGTTQEERFQNTASRALQ